MNKNNPVKRLILGLVVLVLFIFTLSLVSSEEVEKTKISDLKTEDISKDKESQDLLREQYGDLLGYVKTGTQFNSIATNDNIAIINITVNGKDRRILTKLHTGNVVAAGQQDITNAEFIRTNNLVVLGNISLNGDLFVGVDNEYGSRNLYGIGSVSLRYVDEGFSRLVNGEATVSINPVLENLISGYNVFLSAEGLTKGIYVAEKSSSYFVVKSLNSDSNVGFSWMLRGVKKDYDDWLLSSYAEEKGISIVATINYENSTTDIRISGLEEILALVDEIAEDIPVNDTANNVTNQTEEVTINLITGNVVDEFGLETDLEQILGEKTELPALNGNNGQNNNGNNLVNETNNNETGENDDSNIDPVEEISVLEFTLYSTDEDAAISQISSVTGLSVSEVKKLIDFVYVDPIGFEDEIISNDVNLDYISKVNGSVIIKLG